MNDELTAPAPQSRSHRRLKRGDTLGGRFVIVQFLAEGGMGEVYEAADLQLQGKHYALKTLRSTVAANSTLRQRFEREVLLAREVHHSNVCPTYDLFHVDGPSGPITFLTMKLLRGESLLSRLKRAGRFDAEALSAIAKQMAEALDAAHRVGVIHRDFKPGNVMIEYSGKNEPHISITDFGLSRAQEGDVTLAETGQILGTPGYIAPELIQGRIASFTADVYGFGVVLYEMATGKKPFADGGKTPARPTSLAPELPSVWDRIILGCLDPDPSKRFQSAGEAIALLDTPNSSSWTVPIRASMTARRAWVALAVLMTVVAIAAGWFVLPNLDALLHPLPQKRLVALMAWPTPDKDSPSRPLLRSVLDTIGSRLARAESTTKDLLTISTNDVAGASVAAPVDTVSSLGANLVLATSVHDSADGVALDLVLVDPATSKEIRKTELRVPSSELSHLPDRAAVSAAKLLDVQMTSAQWKDPDNLGSVPPEAFQFFTRAEDLMSEPNDKGLDRAIEQYQKAINSDPRFALAYAKLSLAYIRKFLTSKESAALTLATRNAELAHSNNPDSAKAIYSRAMVDLYSGDTQKALDGLQRALKLEPGSPQILLAKGRIFRDRDRRSDEEGVYRDILKERPNFWPAYHALGLSFYRQSKYREAANAFLEGSTVAPRVVSLLTNLGAMYMELEQNKNAEDAFRKSLNLTRTEIAYANLGTLAFESGQYEKAMENYQTALGLNSRDDTVWRNMGDVYAMKGDAPHVTESYGKAADLVAQSLKTNPKRGSAWMTLAFYDAKLGHRKEAQDDLREAEANGASDVPSQFKKAQMLAVLGQKEEELSLVIECIKRGLSPASVKWALDLKDIQNDPRYLQSIASRETDPK